MSYDSVRFIQILNKTCRGDRIHKLNFLTMKQLSLDTVHEMNLIKQIGTPFEFDKKNVNLRLNLAFLAKE